jgi:hypothetical protein
MKHATEKSQKEKANKRMKIEKETKENVTFPPSKSPLSKNFIWFLLFFHTSVIIPKSSLIFLLIVFK